MLLILLQLPNMQCGFDVYVIVSDVLSDKLIYSLKTFKLLLRKQVLSFIFVLALLSL